MYGKLCCAGAVMVAVGCLIWSARGIEIDAADVAAGSHLTDPAVAAQKVIGNGLTMLPTTATYMIRGQSGEDRPHLPEQLGEFSDGLGPAATLPLAQRLLPFLNRDENGDGEDDMEEQTEEFAFTEGGIGLESGIVLSTGRASTDDGGIPPPGVGHGVPYGNGGEGPNNGRSVQFSHGTSLPGEVSTVVEYGFADPVELDIEMRTMLSHAGLQSGANSAVLEFAVNVPQHGRLTFEVVFATDEFPNWITVGPTDYDDAYVILVAHDDEDREWQNLALHNSSDPLGNPNGPVPFRLANVSQMADCRPLFKLNLTAPAPADLKNSSHADFDKDGNRDIQIPYYKHEYGFFTKVLRREIYLAPGDYIVKIVVADGEGDGVDSALFIKENGVYLNTAPFVPGDFDNDGFVGQGDLDLVLLNWGDPAHPIPSGWKNMQNLPIGIIDQEEQDQVLLNWGTQTLARIDFNRDGVVNALDQAILDTYKDQLLACATVNEGDANDDGKVDDDDQAIFNNP